MKHIIAVLLENEPGALSRVVGLFSARGYNIETLTVAPTEDPSMSRMTIVTTGSDEVIEQITKHLNRLIEVLDAEFGRRPVLRLEVAVHGRHLALEIGPKNPGFIFLPLPAEFFLLRPEALVGCLLAPEIGPETQSRRRPP